MSLLLCPDAIKPMIVPTVTRIPRIQGLPPITSGLRVILVRFCIAVFAPLQDPKYFAEVEVNHELGTI
ncbi:MULTISPECIES: hypothetical protein [unclassified Nostoc]|uniref:hypothetical protein n=1 Tax=unclassified Nostoc TaxID=2593658 RepID=UPI001CB9A833|nr:hypothetical protein [Nostoc sp. 'Peltigera membranacea cyanobiont' 213]